MTGSSPFHAEEEGGAAERKAPRLTVLFATHNGAGWIEQLLEGYAAQHYRGGWKMVVVDNASTDETRRILERYREELPLEILDEPLPGKNRALNRGLTAIEGDLVILTDDDTPPHAGFLESWSRLLDEHLDYDLFGGSVQAKFQVPPPPWILRLAETSEAVFAQRKMPTGPVEAGEIFGGNMCVRRRVFEAGIKFNDQIGPNGTNFDYPMGSETDFCRRAVAAGFRTMFFADPCVSHIVRPNQTTPAYFEKVGTRAGRRDALLAHEAGLLRTNLWGHHPLKKHVPVWLQGLLLRGRARLARDPAERMNRNWRYHWWQGYTAETAKLIAGRSSDPSR